MPFTKFWIQPVTLVVEIVVAADKVTVLKRSVVLSELNSEGSIFQRNVRAPRIEFKRIVYITALLQFLIDWNILLVVVFICMQNCIAREFCINMFLNKCESTIWQSMTSLVVRIHSVVYTFFYPIQSILLNFG